MTSPSTAVHVTRGIPCRAASVVAYSNVAYSNDSDGHKKTLSFVGFYPTTRQPEQNNAESADN